MSLSIRRVSVALFICLLATAGVFPVMAAANSSLTVEWDANITDSDLASYRAYMATDPSILALPPVQAFAQSTTVGVDAATTVAVFTALDPAQTYWFAVTSLDTSGNESIFSNIVSMQPPDVTAPVVSITAPAEGATVANSVSVTADSTDDVGVSGVQFMLDGVALGVEDMTAPYAVTWDTTTSADGSHTLTAVARDAVGNTTTSAVITVTVANSDTTAPTVSITAPVQGATVSGLVNVQADASDDTGVVGVQFMLDGVTFGSEDLTVGYDRNWDTTASTNGSHTLTAMARDAAGNTTTSAVITVTVDNSDITAPTVSIVTPVDGATVSGTISVTATSSDDVGVVGVQFKLNGNALGSEDLSNPYTGTFDTTTVGNGTYTLTAVSRDAAGNTTTSAIITITVSNVDTTPPAPPSNVSVHP